MIHLQFLLTLCGYHIWDPHNVRKVVQQLLGRSCVRITLRIIYPCYSLVDLRPTRKCYSFCHFIGNFDRNRTSKQENAATNMDYFHIKGFLQWRIDLVYVCERERSLLLELHIWARSRKEDVHKCLKYKQKDFLRACSIYTTTLCCWDDDFVPVIFTKSCLSLTSLYVCVWYTLICHCLATSFGIRRSIHVLPRG